jgi:hypothetical protein
MGTVISGIVDVVSQIAGAVVDAGTTITHLQGIAKDMTAGPPPPPSAAFSRLNARTGMSISSPVTLFARAAAVASSDDVSTALKGAMDAAKTAATTLFSSQFAEPPTGSTNGVVSGYSATGGDLSSVVTQLKNSFTIWNLPLNDTQIGQMASTLQTQVEAQMGRGGSSWGKFVLNMNQTALWTVAYGLFQINETKQGLVYGFAGGMDSGFGG